jgi:UDP-glucose 4-epimerase
VKIVVTGGAGFIGANLCRRLAAEDHTVLALDDLSTGHKDNLRDIDVELVEGTILDAGVLDFVLRDAGAVVHLAARTSVPLSVDNPVASHVVNATGTVEVLEAVRRAGNPYVVMASSSSVYGANPILPKREDLATLPMSPYAASKLAAEAYTLAYHHSYDIAVLPLRFFNVFGPLQSASHAYAAVVPAFLSAATEGRPLIVHGDGLQSRDFTFVETVTEVIADAVRRRLTSAEPLNLAFGTRTNILTLAHLVEEIAGCAVGIEHVPPRVGDVRESESDPTRLQALFPHVVPSNLRDALEVTYAWFRSDQSR